MENAEYTYKNEETGLEIFFSPDGEVQIMGYGLTVADMETAIAEWREATGN